MFDVYALICVASLSHVLSVAADDGPKSIVVPSSVQPGVTSTMPTEPAKRVEVCSAECA